MPLLMMSSDCFKKNHCKVIFFTLSTCLDKKDQGDEMKNACKDDEQMPYKMKIRMLRLRIKNNADRIHDAAEHDEDQK